MKKKTRTELTAMFLARSLQDSIENSGRALSKPSFPHWDAVIITASDENQAKGYRQQIDARREEGSLPGNTDFIIVPDRGNRRVGSAGSTLSVIRELRARYGALEGKKFLCIHAGGDSKRCPQYSALGKLFSPVPMMLGGRPAALFDLLSVTMASVPGRLKDGMLLLSGDVILLFNPLMCDFGSADAAVISFSEPAELGKDHGVYVSDGRGNVKRFLHKQTVETLAANGAVDERGSCAIDTGAIYISPAILDRLYGLVDTEEKYAEMVNERVRLSLYGDIAYCLAGDSTLEAFYGEAPEGEFCPELRAARERLWEAIGGYSVKLLSVAPAKFVHFGTVGEIMRLMDGGVFEFGALGWSRSVNSSIDGDRAAGYNSVLAPGAVIGRGCYLENSYVHGGVTVGDNSYLSFVEIEEGEIPPDTVVHGLKLDDGTFVCRIWPAGANPKEFWTEKRYRPCATMAEAVRSSLERYGDGAVRGSCPAVSGSVSGSVFGSGSEEGLLSLADGFARADSRAIIDWSKRMEELVRMDGLSALITAGRPASEAKDVLGARRLTAIQEEWLEEKVRSADTSKLSGFSYVMRLYYYLGAALDDGEYTARCFSTIAGTVLSATLKNLRYNENARIAEDETVVRLPLRVNFGGGWSDTCPHCLEHGGAVLNAAISLGGKLPVEVRLVKIKERKIVFDSRDMDVHGEFTDIGPLQDTGDPFDPFALQKACLLACGVIPKQGGDLAQILERLGGGFEMHSEVTDVPKGSGLGTSSILSAAAVRAMLTFTGMEYDDDTLYSTVLAMEQIMSTGGGWQDQVGGVTPGIKFITSDPGIEQKISVERVVLSEETKRELQERFAVIYTGQRRLARNLLRDVVGRYVGNVPESLLAHREIQRYAAMMKEDLERGDVDGFARLLDEHWQLSQMIDAGSTNTLIDQIFMTIEDLIDARMVCGAGGGGFLQVVLKKGVTKAQVHDRLREVFEGFAVDVWESEIVWD